MIPKELREHLGLQPGVVEVVADGAALRVEPLAGAELEERDGRLVIPASGGSIGDNVGTSPPREELRSSGGWRRRTWQVVRSRT